MITDSADIIAIVATYNGALWIEKCLASLQHSSVPMQVLVVDNGSTDLTVQLVKGVFPVVELIETGSNLGFGSANNIGLKKAIESRAAFVFLLNQDAWVETNTVHALVQAAQQYPDYGILSPFHLNWEGSETDHFFLRMVGPDSCKGFLSDSFLQKVKDVYTLDFIHAACWLITRKCLIEVGGFDPLFYHYGEDNDYVMRATIKGLKTGIVPAVKVYHAGYFDPAKDNNENEQLRLIHALVDLKKMSGSLKANYFLFIKERLDRFSTLFLTKHFRRSFTELRMITIPFRYHKRIMQARKASGKPKAFLT